jgi:hypothetical protein
MVSVSGIADHSTISGSELAASPFLLTSTLALLKTATAVEFSWTSFGGFIHRQQATNNPTTDIRNPPWYQNNKYYNAHSRNIAEQSANHAKKDCMHISRLIHFSQDVELTRRKLYDWLRHKNAQRRSHSLQLSSASSRNTECVRSNPWVTLMFNKCTNGPSTMRHIPTNITTRTADPAVRWSHLWNTGSKLAVIASCPLEAAGWIV